MFRWQELMFVNRSLSLDGSLQVCGRSVARPSYHLNIPFKTLVNGFVSSRCWWRYLNLAVRSILCVCPLGSSISIIRRPLPPSVGYRPKLYKQNQKKMSCCHVYMGYHRALYRAIHIHSFNTQVNCAILFMFVTVLILV